ncbi:MAG: choice-of-anchor U domain-containing protein [Patescibacteria group bacterium]
MERTYSYIKLLLIAVLGVGLVSLIGQVDATPGTTDTDNDLVLDTADLDDDNDGILDTAEGFSPTASSATIAPTSSASAPCSICAPTGWTIRSGTPDMSDVNTVADSGTSGGGSAWDNAPLPAPPTGDSTFITVRDIGLGGASQEIVGTTITGLESGATYRVSFYAMTSHGGAYGSTYEDAANLIIAGTTIPFVPTQDSWGLIEHTFTATGTTADLEFQPGANASRSSSSDYSPTSITADINIVYVPLDTDGDGIPDYQDLDSDNDGISDIYESADAAVIAADTTEDGTIDITEAAVGGGYTEGVANVAGSGSSVGTSTSLDADVDGIPDATEARASNAYIAYIGTSDAHDADDDGILDIYDSDGTATIGGGAIFGSTLAGFKTGNTRLANADGDDTADTIPDFLDGDSDGDGLPDSSAEESGTITGVSFSDPDGNVNDPLTSGTLDNDDDDYTGADVDFRSVDDNDPPVITLNSIPDVNDAYDETNYPVSGNCTTGDGDVTIVISGAAPNPATASCSAGTYSTTVDTSAIADGDDVIIADASQTDAAGNTGNAAQQTADKDTEITVTISALATVNASTDQVNYGLSGSCEDGGTNVTVAITGATPGSQNVSCTSGAWSATFDVSAIADGDDVMIADASQADAAGNTGNAAQQTADKDTGLPAVSINDSTIAPVGLNNATSYLVEGLCEAVDDQVKLTISDGSSTVINTVSCLDDGSGSGEFSSNTDVSSLNPGVVTIVALVDDGVNPAVSDNALTDIPEDLDSDDTSSEEEKQGPNSGDGNNDGIQDYLQDSVTTKVNPILESYVTTELVGDCSSLDAVSFYVEPELAAQDVLYEYALGLHGFEADCVTAGGSVAVTHYWDQVYDTSEWVYRKLVNSQYVDFSDQVTYNTANIGGKEVTTVSFSIVDGGEYDADGLANGRIVDPTGPAVLTETLAETGATIYVDTILGVLLISFVGGVAMVYRLDRIQP